MQPPCSTDVREQTFPYLDLIFSSSFQEHTNELIATQSEKSLRDRRHGSVWCCTQAQVIDGRDFWAKESEKTAQVTWALGNLKPSFSMQQDLFLQPFCQDGHPNLQDFRGKDTYDDL